MSDQPVVEVNEVRKTYGATVALDGASLKVATGSVHALLGENGAGKSTMVKILSGLVQPNSGEIRVCGEQCRLSSPRVAQRLGLQTAFQEMTQVRDLTVTQNLLLNSEPVTGLGFLRKRRAEEVAVAHLDALGLGFIDPRAEVRDLDLPVRQKLEIARAVLKKPKLLLLDEPTSTLSGRDIDWLGRIIAETKASGASVVFISHRMPEVAEFCEFLTVFRNGKDVGTARVGELPEEEIVRMIIGRSLSSTFPPKATPRLAETPRLSARNLSAAGRLKDASFDLAPGEVLGVSGLQGMGMQELFLGCFGATPLSGGHIEINGKRVTLMSPRDAVRQNIGVSLVPEDRKTEGLFLKLDGLKNMSLPVLDRFTRFGLIDGEAESAAVRDTMQSVQVHDRALFTRAGAFSGGNQQKISIGKWLLTGSRILLLYDPTRGVDVGTKHEIYVLIHEFAKAGGSVLLFSSEIPELVNLCHRVLVMYRGAIVLELDGDELDEETIIRAALGESVHATPARAQG